MQEDRQQHIMMIAFALQLLPKADLFYFFISIFFLRLKALIEETNNPFSRLESKRKNSEVTEERKKEAFIRFPIL